METKDIYGKECPTLYTLDIICGKWRLPILWKLSEHDCMRFSELKKEVTGITNLMLTKCLQEFEVKKVITRIQYDEVPPRVEYSLTQSGLLLVQILEDLNTWGMENMVQ